MHGDDNDTWHGEMRKRVSGEIRFDEPADCHTSLGVGGRIDALVVPKDVSEIAETIAFLRARRIPFLPVGNWTNLIVRGGGYRGVLISLTGLHGLEIRDSGEGEVRVEAEAGVALSELVTLSMHEGLTGMEFCAGIPGSVGGAVRMNAGACGSEIKDVVITVRLLADPAEGIRTVTRDSLIFGYRNLDLPAETIIIGATFRLKRGEQEKIAGRIREILSLRKEKHPLEFRNAGSIFKNPREIPAGRLIESAGLKGLRIGDAEVSAKHGNFIVNRGQASAAEVLSLIDLVQKRVFEATGHSLETEVRIIGE
jgi:UDP-N-acetylmuramate dehydrogenase